MKAFAAGIVAAGWLLAAADPADDATKKDAQKLQGTWTVVMPRPAARTRRWTSSPFRA